MPLGQDQHFRARRQTRARDRDRRCRAERDFVFAARHVEKALESRVFRSNRIEEDIRELIANGTILVDIDGKKVGQVNGLSVMEIGGYAFGRPSRVTASVGMGPVSVGYALTVELKVLLPGLEKSIAEEVVAGAHERCPYSNATRGNIDVKLTVL